MRKPPPRPRRADPSTSLPHDSDRESRQPYAKELDDYEHGVVTPPEEQGGREADRGAATKRMRK